MTHGEGCKCSNCFDWLREQYDLGTPKTLYAAIERGNSTESIEVAVRDYLAQKFGAAMLENAPDAVLVLKKLWEAL